VATVAAKIALMSTMHGSKSCLAVSINNSHNGFEAPIEYSMFDRFRSGIKLHQVELEIFIAGQEKAYCKYALLRKKY
jgi:hypothetical protein